MSLSLIISNLTLDEIKQLLKHVREIEQESPQRLIFCQVQGLEEKSLEEAQQILLEIFPEKPDGKLEVGIKCKGRVIPVE